MTEPDIDKRGKLDENPFEYQITKDNRVLIYWANRLIKTLKGKEAEKLIARIESADEKDIQLALAKVTGNFKRGNEK